MPAPQDMSRAPGATRRHRLARRLLALALAAAACRGERATADDCAAILDRIVSLELAEQGFVDPELTRRKLAEFTRRFAAELARCEGLRLPTGARACVAAATSSEQISHVCLR